MVSTGPGAATARPRTQAQPVAAEADEALSLPTPSVREELASKSLYFSSDDVQSRMQLQHPDVLELRYTRTMMAFVLFQPAPRAIAMVGLGGGSLAKFCHRHLRGSRIDVVEINPAVIALREEFRVPGESARFRVVEADGAVYMRETAREYDVIMLDAFGPRGLPPQVASQRFYDDCHDRLAARGVLVANFHSAAADFPLCVARLRRSFEQHLLVVGDGERINSIVFARKAGPLLTAEAARAIRARAAGAAPVGGRCRLDLPRRPPGLDGAAWAQLGGAVRRVAAALAGQEGARAAAGHAAA